MFESITHRNSSEPNQVIDIGALAESLIFYGRVNIAANSATLKYLVQKIPPFILLSLLKDNRLEIHYLDDDLSVRSRDDLSLSTHHSLVRFSSPNHKLELVAPEIFRQAAGNNSQAKIGARQFARLIKHFDHVKFDQLSLISTLSQHNAMRDTVKGLLNEVAPAFVLPNDFRFAIEASNGGRFQIDTNLDFLSLNKVYHKTIPPEHSTITGQYLVALVQSAYQSAYIAAELNTEIATHPIERKVFSSTIEEIIKRYDNSQKQVSLFTDVTLSESHAIREAVNAGKIPFSSVVGLLDSAEKFKHWLHQQPADGHLMRAYYQETIKDSWVNKLPAKSMRWSIFTGIGLGLDALGAGGLGTAAGVGVSIVDSFIVDKLIGGWKPHQFVEKELRPILHQSNEAS